MVRQMSCINAKWQFDMATIPIDKLAEHLNISIDQAARAFKVEVFNEAVRGTIVREGRLRNNWMISEGSPSNETIDQGGSADAIASAKAAEIERTVESDDAATQHWLTNNLAYAPIINNRDGIVEKARSHGVNNAERILKNAGT